jgi:hypothetical protein
METLAMVSQAKHEPYTTNTNSPRTKKERQVKGKAKSVLIIFFHIKGIVLKEFVLARQTVNSAYYCDFYGNCVKMCKNFALNFGNKRTGCCIMTTHCLTLPFAPGNLLLKAT